jgi:hypothetical protein
VPLDKYLQRHAEAEARPLLDYRTPHAWHQVLVIPAYREPADFAAQLQQLALRQPGLLIILVLNRPDSDSDCRCNDALRNALLNFPLEDTLPTSNAALLQLAPHSHLLLVERPDPLPADQGVGLARKLGCDLALALAANKTLCSHWIHSSDADAILPEDYFEASTKTSKAVALTFPFIHRLPEAPRARLAMQLYELRLHYYVLGLQRAGSPYAYHSLGSCLAIDTSAYARVRGFPKRSGAEDFYLLNKVAKLGAVARPPCAPIELAPRLSSRVPFGTGPALAQLAELQQVESATLFYHPHSFTLLGRVLTAIAAIQQPAQARQQLQQKLAQSPVALRVLDELGLDKFLHHAANHSADQAGFGRHFKQWFDGFRTLKFIHCVREQGFADLNLEQSLSSAENPWPAQCPDTDPQTLLLHCQAALLAS